MADKTAEDAPDTTVATDTSTNDEPDTTAIEDSMDDIDWEDGDKVGSDENDPKPKDSQASDPKKAKDDSKSEEDEEESTDPDTTDKPADDAETTEESDKPDSDVDTQETKTTLTPEEQKAHNDEMAKARIAEREAKESAATAKKDASEATIERYLREAGDDELELERRQLNVEAYRLQEEKIDINQQKLQTGIDRAVASIDLFRTGSEAVKEELANSLDDFERMYVVKDKDGRPTEVKGDVVKFLQAKADSIKRIRSDGAVQQDKSKTKQQTRTLTTPVKAPKKAKVDEEMAAFDKEAARY